MSLSTNILLGTASFIHSPLPTIIIIPGGSFTLCRNVKFQNNWFKCLPFFLNWWVGGWLFVGWQQQRMAKWTRKHWVGGGRVGTINRLKESQCPGNPQLISLTQTVLLVLLYVPGWMVVERTHCCCCCEGGWIAAILKTFHFCHITNERQPIIKFCTARQAFGQQTDRASQ